MIYILYIYKIMNNYLEIKKINEEIVKLNKNELKEVFKLIYDNNSLFTRNSNGIFINLSKLNSDILYKIKNYIDFCINSHIENKNHEILKNNLYLNINKKTEEDNTDICIPVEVKAEEDKTVIIKKINSNMKFYLAKKKLDFKGKTQKYVLNDVLTKDNIII